jgi:hypothetical protein
LPTKFLNLFFHLRRKLHLLLNDSLYAKAEIRSVPFFGRWRWPRTDAAEPSTSGCVRRGVHSNLVCGKILRLDGSLIEASIRRRWRLSEKPRGFISIFH